MFLNSISNLRGIAIILVFAAHSYGFAGIPQTPGNDYIQFSKNIITGATALFIFVSGYMFHHVFVKRYTYRSFMTGKVKNVLIPYLVLTTLCVLYVSLVFDDPRAIRRIIPEEYVGTLPGYLIAWMKYLLTANFFVPYWFIPTMMLIFLMSPLHMAYLRLSLWSQIVIMIAWLLASTVIHRSEFDFDFDPIGEPIHNTLYYTPIYLMGITLSAYRTEALQLFRGRELFILTAYIAIVCVQTWAEMPAHATKPFFAYEGINISNIQKAAQCLLLFAFLERWQSLEFKWLTDVSETSFAIFFLHGIVLAAISPLRFWRIDEPSVLIFVLFIATVVLIYVLIAIGMRKVLGKKSRYIIGY